MRDCYLFVFVRGVAMAAAGAHLVDDWAEQRRREEEEDGWLSPRA
jgi:hypothetical protein